MKFINVGGIPTSGKSDLIRLLLRQIGPGDYIEPVRWICGSIHHEHKLIILGRYFSKRELEGTDAIERTAHKRGGPQFLDWVQKNFSEYIVLCEGERFMKRPFAKTLLEMGVPLEYVYLDIEESVRLERQGERLQNSIQKEESLKRWNSFYRKWQLDFPAKVLASNSFEDQRQNLIVLKQMIGFRTLAGVCHE